MFGHRNKRVPNYGENNSDDESSLNLKNELLEIRQKRIEILFSENTKLRERLKKKFDLADLRFMLKIILYKGEVFSDKEKLNKLLRKIRQYVVDY